MKTILLLIICTLFIKQSLFCQSELLNYKLNTISKKVKLFQTYNNDTDELAVTHVDNEKIHRWVFKNKILQYDFVQSSLTPREEIRIEPSIKKIATHQLICGIIKNGILLEYFKDSKDAYIIALETNLAQHQTIIKDSIDLGRDEYFATAFTQNNTFYFLSYVKKSNNLKLYKRNWLENFSVIENKIILSEKDKNGYQGEIIKNKLGKKGKDGIGIKFFKGFTNEFSGFFRDGYSVIYNGQNNTSSTSIPQNKIYIFPNKLVFTLDNQYFRTTVVDISLNDLSYSKSFYAQPFLQKDDYVDVNRSATNSFVLDSLIVLGNVINSSFHFAVFNRNTGNIIKCHTIEKNKTDFFGKSKVNKVEFKGAIIDSGLTTMQYLVDKMEGNDIAINLLRTENNIDVTLCTFYDKITFGQVLLSLTISALGTYGINATPNSAGFSLFFAKNNNPLSYVYYNSLLDEKTFEEKDGYGLNYYSDKEINKLIISKRLNAETSFIVSENFHNYIGYVDLDDKTLVVKYY